MSHLRVLFAPLGHFLSHRSRCLAVAEALHERGHEVAFLCVPGEEAFFASRGMGAFAVHHLRPEAILPFGAPLSYQRRFLAETGAGGEPPPFGVAQMVEDDLRVYDVFRPDVVIWDGRPTAPLTASLQGIPVIAINNLSMPYDDGPLAAGGEPPVTVQGRFQAELREVLAPRLLADARQARGLKHLAWIVPGLPVTENAAKLQLLGDPVHTYVGPLHWRGWDELPGPSNLPSGRPRVLVTLGSTFPFAQVAWGLAEALAADGFEVVLNMDRLEGRGGERAGLTVLPRLNLREFLAASDLVIHHAGHGTALEALRAGVPALMLPFNGDQIDIARRIDKLGCGLALPGYPGDIEGHQVRDAARLVLADASYRTAAARFREELARWPQAATLAADFVERRVPQVRQLLQ